MNEIIEVHGLKKSYGDFPAVQGISFSVEQGKLFSFLGPNGAGKSTTINILCTLLEFNSGTVTIDGLDLTQERHEIRRRIGVVFQENMLDSLLTVRENLTVRAGLYTSEKEKIKKAVYEASQAAELNEFIDRPYGKLSGGQKRRADIARALIHRPKILFLDEPTTGLDPQTRKSIWGTIKKLQTETGMTVFLTTHYMEEAAESDSIIVIDHGKLVAKGTPSELKSQYACDMLQMNCRDEDAVRDALCELRTEYTALAGKLTVKLPDTMHAMRILKRCEPFLASFEVLQGSMDDAFIGITGKELRE